MARAGRAPALALAALSLLSACGPPRFAYVKRGVTPATYDRDLGACRREAHRPGRFAIMTSDRVDPDALNRCMERKGYAVHPDE